MWPPAGWGTTQCSPYNFDAILSTTLLLSAQDRNRTCTGPHDRKFLLSWAYDSETQTPWPDQRADQYKGKEIGRRSVYRLRRLVKASDKAEVAGDLTSYDLFFSEHFDLLG